ncbi:Domain of unknown function DUF4203 [Plasmopara halstedii]|uniref:Transmembrane protein 198 n=1 Tax=Plasmopara halstedii TaxID=4781 RepID=A0A0N7L5I7_PLAHL|nr:Domain of unknown function DUF4203 [Plasmopara halstedii]CEG41587.1 Domain of unknown function DUF4203 [Plasmopara halstedii]|eukprot:XP_024577956.1 Domain of unknown function DUF4203 [Plasmopara halstedii]
MMSSNFIVLILALCLLSVYGHKRRSEYFPHHLHVEPGVAAEFAIFVGLSLCFYGFRLLRAIIFLSGFVVTGTFMSLALASVFGLGTWVLAASWISFFVFGVAGGCVALAFFPFGVFLVGSMFAYAITLSLPYQMLPIDLSAVLNGAIIVLGGMLGWLLVRHFTIIASSFVGAVSIIRGIGYFTGKYPTNEDIKCFYSHLEHSELWMSAIPKLWWAFLAAMFALLVTGVVKQYRDIDKHHNYNHIGRYNGWRSTPYISIP